MSETLSFPGLGLEFQLNPVAFTVFGWPIRWYGIIFASGALIAMLYVFRRVREFGVDADRMTDVLLGSIVGGLIGARTYYVLFTWNEVNYRDDLMKVFRVWEGGIAMYGSIIGAVLFGVLLCRWRNVKFLPALDVGLTGLILAQAIGRWGNFVNIEAFGSNTAASWGMTGSSIVRYLQWQQSTLETIGVTVDPYMPVHPTFFYESVWCLLGFMFLVWYTKRRRFDGELSLLYLAWYGFGRFFIEGLRTDSLRVGTIRVSQMLALVCVIAAGIALLSIRSRIRREGDPAFMLLYVDTDEGRAVVDGTFYVKKGSEPEESGESEESVDPEESPEPEEPQETKEPDGSGEAGQHEDPESPGQGKNDTAQEDETHG